MPKTEFATLELIAPFEVYHPDILPIFRLLSERQAAWSGYPLHFYQNTTKSSEIYLVSGWKDVPAHYEWIASDENQELLTVFKPYVDVKDLVHLDLDFRRFKEKVEYLEVEVTHGERRQTKKKILGQRRCGMVAGRMQKESVTVSGASLRSARVQRAQIK